MSPRRSAAAAQETREAIIDRAVSLGSLEGLEGLSFGRVAASASLSKSGVLRHFSTKEDLQLAVLREASDRFRAAIWDPVANERAGVDRLRAVMSGWIEYLVTCPLPGGCLFTASAMEFDGRPGPVRDAVEADAALWQRTLERDIDVAVRAGELADVDPVQLAFELLGVALAVNQTAQLHDDPGTASRGRAAVDRLLAG